MQTPATQGIPKADTDRELDRALASGPLKDIVIPPCPELLMALRVEMDKADPNPQVIADIAGRDVAMAASLIRTANSPYYARSRPVTSVGEALGLLGMRMTEKLLTAFLQFLQAHDSFFALVYCVGQKSSQAVIEHFMGKRSFDFTNGGRLVPEKVNYTAMYRPGNVTIACSTRQDAKSGIALRSDSVLGDNSGLFAVFLVSGRQPYQ